MTTTQEPLRFAVLLEEKQLNRWQVECVSQLVDSSVAELEVAIRVARRERWSLQRIRFFLRHILWYGFLWTLSEGALIHKRKKNSLQDIELLTGSLTAHKGTLELEDDVIANIRSKKVDFILHFGESRPCDNLMRVARYGVWSFKFGGLASNADTPPAFWESMRGDCVTKAELRRFSPGKNPLGLVLRSGFFSVGGFSYRRTITHMLRAIVDFPVLACRDFLAGRIAEPAVAELDDGRPSFGLPGNAAMLSFIARMFRRKATGLFQAAFMRIQWNTGFLQDVSLDPSSSTVAKNVCWFAISGPADFAADPFFIRRDDTTIFTRRDIRPHRQSREDSCSRSL